MKKTLSIFVIMLIFSLCACGNVPADSSTEPTNDQTSVPIVTPTHPSSSSAAETPDSAGSGDVLFDIYKENALVDIDKDGSTEKINFEAEANQAVLSIDGVATTISKAGLSQLFAVTDVDKSDSYLELVLTDQYSSELADTEFPNSYLYWWNGSALVSMGSLTDVKFAGSWRNAFDAAKYFKANGEVYCLAHTTELTDIWYMKQSKPNGANRQLKEVLYFTQPVNTVEPLTIKAGKACLLLAHGDSTFFKSSYNAMWDYASYPHILGRAIAPTDDIVIIAQGGETLTVTDVIGPNWVRLKTADNYKGWVKVEDGKIQGYWQVMHDTASDIFDGIVIAG